MRKIGGLDSAGMEELYEGDVKEPGEAVHSDIRRCICMGSLKGPRTSSWTLAVPSSKNLRISCGNINPVARIMVNAQLQTELSSGASLERLSKKSSPKSNDSDSR